MIWWSMFYTKKLFHYPFRRTNNINEKTNLALTLFLCPSVSTLKTLRNCYRNISVSPFCPLFASYNQSLIWCVKISNNKSNWVWTTDAFSLVLVPTIILTLVLQCSHDLKVAQILLFSCFRPLSISIWVKNGSISWFPLVCCRPTEGLRDGRTHPLIEMHERM